MMKTSAFLAVAAVACASRADVLRWINASGGSFTAAANWDLGRVPGSSDSVVFDLDAAYTVTVPVSPGVTIVGMDVARGQVTIAGSGGLGLISLMPNAANHRLYVGDGSVAARLTLNNARVTTNAAAFEVRAGSTAVMTGGGSFFAASSFGELRVLPGAVLRVDNGSVSPGALVISGAAEVTAGTMNGEVVTMNAGGRVLASGATARFTYENAMTLAGLVEITNGARLSPLSGGFLGPTAAGCDLRLSQGGRLDVSSFRNDAASSVTLSTGAQWNPVSTMSEYRGPFRAGPGTTVRLPGVFYAAVELDQAGSNSLSSFTDLRAGLTAEIDGLVTPSGPVVQASGAASDVVLAGALTVRVRNSNALRVGDVIPVLAHNSRTFGGFTSLVAPELGGGRVLEMFSAGTPLVTSVRVVAGPPSCYLDADFNGDGDVGTDQDIEAFFACLGGNCCAGCATADFNGDGDVGTDQDIEAYFRVLGGGSC